MLKEASYLKFGESKKVYDLSSSDSSELWKALQKSDFTQFSIINKKLHSEDIKELKNIPIRLLYAKNQLTWVQEPIPVADTNGNFFTF